MWQVFKTQQTFLTAHARLQTNVLEWIIMTFFRKCLKTQSTVDSSTRSISRSRRVDSAEAVLSIQCRLPQDTAFWSFLIECMHEWEGFPKLGSNAKPRKIKTNPNPDQNTNTHLHNLNPFMNTFPNPNPYSNPHPILNLTQTQRGNPPLEILLINDLSQRISSQTHLCGVKAFLIE